MLHSLTCHYCADHKKDAEEYVPRQYAEFIHDFPLADGEYDSKHLHMENIRTHDI